jgi:hypothetical protein
MNRKGDARMKSPRTLPAKRRYWKKHVHAWRTSGLPQRRYARLHGIHPRTFFDWCRKFPERKSTPDHRELSSGTTLPKFNPVELVPIPARLLSSAEPFPARQTKLSIKLGKRFRIVVGKNFSASLLKQVIQTLEDLL